MPKPPNAADRRYFLDCLEAGDTVEQIVAWSGFTVQQVRRAIEGCSALSRPAPAPKLPRIDRTAIVTAWIAGAPVKVIAAQHACDRETVYQIVRPLAAAGVVAPGSRVGTYQKRPAKMSHPDSHQQSVDS